VQKDDYIYYDPDAEKRKGVIVLVVIFFLGLMVGILLMKFIF